MRELFLVSENSTSYGKDLGDLRLLETLLPELAAIDGVERVRVSYLQPAETRPGLIEAIATTPGRGAVLRPLLPARQQRRCCAGCAASATRRASSACSTGSATWRPRPASAPTSSSASPARPRTTSRPCATSWSPPGMDVTGVFGYSDEDGTEAASYDDKLDEDEVRARTEHVTALVEELTAQRAEERIGETVDVLVESRRRRRVAEGRADAPGARGRRHHAAARRTRRWPSVTWCARGSSAPTASTWSRRPSDDPVTEPA